MDGKCHQNLNIFFEDVLNLISRLFQIKAQKNFLAHNFLFYSAVSIVVLQAKQAGSVLRSIYKSFTIASTRFQHGQHNSRFLDCPWESTFSASTPPRQLFVFVKLENRPLFLHQREGMAKKDIQNKVTVFIYFLSHYEGAGQSSNFLPKNQSLVFLEKVVQIYHKNLNA